MANFSLFVLYHSEEDTRRKVVLNLVSAAVWSSPQQMYITLWDLRDFSKVGLW